MVAQDTLKKSVIIVIDGEVVPQDLNPVLEVRFVKIIQHRYQYTTPEALINGESGCLDIAICESDQEVVGLRLMNIHEHPELLKRFIDRGSISITDGGDESGNIYPLTFLPAKISA